MKKLQDLKFLFIRAYTLAKDYLFLSLIKNVFSALLPLTNIFGIGMVIDALMNGKPLKAVMQIITIYLSVNLTVALIRHILNLFDNNIMRKVSNVLQYEYIEDSVYIDYHYVQDGGLQNLKSKSMMAHPAFFISTWGNFFNYLIQFIGILSIFSVLSPWFVLIILVISTLLICMTLLTQKCDFDFNNSKVETDRQLDYLYTVMTEYKYAKEIRINNANQFIQNKYIKVFSNQLKNLKKLYQKKIKINSLSSILTVVQTAIMYLYFTFQVSDKQISIAEYTILLSSTTLFASILLSLFSTIGLINNNCKSVEFYREYTDIVQKNSRISNGMNQEAPNTDFSNAIIRFENVSFHYPNTSNYVLQNINIEIRPKEKLGIVGLNGSGKTTLIKLLCRIYDPSEGRITINGIDIRQIPYQFFVNHIGIVLQDFSLFSYSVEENIVFDRILENEKIQSCLEKSGLLHKLSRLPKGIQTIVYKALDDDGVEFSGGEGQKLALARMLYKDANILILDEPTSFMDPIAEEYLFSQMKELSKEKTAIFISHRLSSTRQCDKIIVLENGRITEYGDHEMLLHNGGIYAKLFCLQAKCYKEGKEFSE